VGDELERLLDKATREFVNSENNVSVDHASRTVTLSSIFKWYEKDFTDYLVATGRPAQRGLLDYLETAAQGTLLSDLQQANDYAIRFSEYDWSLNQAD
jgi:hypothetical protein